MTFLEDIKQELADDDLSVIYDKDVTSLYYEIIDERRWYNRVFQVFRKGLETVGVEYNVGSTEMQEDTELNGEAYYVRPEPVTVIKYVRATEESYYE